MHFAPLSSIVLFLCTRSLVQAQAPSQTNYTGDLFIFDPGLGACGFTNTSSQTVASVSQIVFQAFPGAGKNPNKNPICHRKASITRNDGTPNFLVPIVDFFTDASPGSKYNLGLSLPGFEKFAPKSEGIVTNITWTII